MQSSPHILVVDDDQEIRNLLGRYLHSQGLRVTLASSRRQLEEKLRTNAIDLIVMDIMLPDGSGLEICRDRRLKYPGIPIVLLTALKEDMDRIIGLEIGADDYLGKPFNPRELVARIRAVLRRKGETPPLPTARKFRFAGFIVDVPSRQVLRPDGQDVPLTSAEFDLLRTFLERPGRVLSRDQLLDLARHRSADVFDRSIDVLMSRLRRKLGDEMGKAIFKTVRNGGYQMVSAVEMSEE